MSKSRVEFTVQEVIEIDRELRRLQRRIEELNERFPVKNNPWKFKVERMVFYLEDMTGLIDRVATSALGDGWRQRAADEDKDKNIVTLFEEQQKTPSDEDGA